MVGYCSLILERRKLIIFYLIEIINELKDADDLQSTFRQIAKDKSDCSSGQRGGMILT